MNEQAPSKEKLPDWLRRWYALKGEPRFREAADEIDRLQDRLDIVQEQLEKVVKERNDLRQAAQDAELKRLANEPRAERTPSDYAIEHAEYFAKSVEDYRKARMSHDALLDAEETDPDRLQRSAEALTDHWAAVGNLMYEFRKRVERARTSQPPGNDAEDAAKWRALRNCARITAHGSAGCQPSAKSFAKPYAHVTLSFWTHNEREQEPWHREWFDAFVSKALRATSTKEVR